MIDMRDYCDDLGDFDTDLVGFDCHDQITDELINGHIKEWQCPFNPGCDAKRRADCEMLKRRALVQLHAPTRQQ